MDNRNSIRKPVEYNVDMTLISWLIHSTNPTIQEKIKINMYSLIQRFAKQYDNLEK